MQKYKKSFDKDSADQIWSNYQSYIRHLESNTFFREAFEVLEERIKVLNPKSVLDIGSGFGWTSLLLADWLKPSFVTSSDPIVEISKEDLGSLAKIMKLDMDNLGVERKIWKFDDIGSGDPSWDMIVCVASIHHAHEIARDLGSLFQGLKPGGTLILANEVIYSVFKYRVKMIKKMLKLLFNNFTKKWTLNDQLIGQGRFKYNSELGDWSISKDYYCFLAEVIGFNKPEFIETDYVSYREVGHSGNEMTITHVILTKPM